MKRKKPIRPLAYKKYIDAVCDRLRKTIFAREYDMNLVFCREIEGNGFHGQGNAAASVRTDPTYLNLTIHIGDEHILKAWREKDYEFIGRCLCHEMSHVLTEPLYKIAVEAATKASQQFVEEARERQTERIASTIFVLMPKGWCMPGKIFKQ